MTFRDEMIPYINNYGYAAGSKVQGLGRTCDNHILFTALYYITLKLRGESLPTDRAEVERLINNITLHGVLLRYPGDIESVDDSFDNYVAYAALCVHFKLWRPMLRTVVRMITHIGFLNATKVFTRNAYFGFPRFPTLCLCAFPAALGLPSPFNIWVGLVTIVNSNKGEPRLAADNRKNAWLLIQAMSNSYFCRKGAKVWLRNVFLDYLGDELDDGSNTTAFRLMLLAYFVDPQYPLVKYGVPGI